MGFTKAQMDERFSDIGEFIGQPARTYSSGMFVRLAMEFSKLCIDFIVEENRHEAIGGA